MTLIKRLVVSLLIGTFVIIVFLLQILKFEDRDKRRIIMMENESLEISNVQILQYSFHESCNCSRSLPNLKSMKKSIDFGNLDELPDGSFVGKLQYLTTPVSCNNILGPSTCNDYTTALGSGQK